MCAVQLDWQAVDASQVTQLFVRQGAGAPQRISLRARNRLPRHSVDHGGRQLHVRPLPDAQLRERDRRRRDARRQREHGADIPELPGSVVELAGGVRIGMGAQLRPSGRHDLRNVVHLRCGRQAVVAGGRGEQDRGQRLCGQAQHGHRAAVQRGSFRPEQSDARGVGTATFTFTDNDQRTFAYTVDGISQTKPITRQLFASPVPTCIWGGRAELALATNYQDMWWAAPAGSESGWGINFAHQGDTIFGTWFTFAATGKPLWLAVGRRTGGAGVYTGSSRRRASLQRRAVRPDKVAGPRGHRDVHLRRRQQRDLRLHGQRLPQTKQITREVFAPPGTACK